MSEPLLTIIITVQTVAVLVIAACIFVLLRMTHAMEIRLNRLEAFLPPKRKHPNRE
jgi:hypothetical protein